MDTRPDEYELAVKARQGDREALAELVERLRMSLFALAYAELRHYEDAQDAVAAGLLQVCLHVGELREPERVRAWVQTIVRNEVRQIRRRRTPEVAEASLEHAEPGTAEAGSTVLRLDIERALRHLPRDQARALTLFYLSGLSVHDIARRTGRPQGTITRWLHVGRRQLAQQMKEYAPMTHDLTATIIGTDLDPTVVHRLTGALQGAGFGTVRAQTEVRSLSELYRVDKSHWPIPKELRVAAPLEDSRFILLDEWIAGRSAFELLSILKATPEGKNTAYCLLIPPPSREESTVFAAWAAGFDLCFARETEKAVLQQWFARVREGLVKGWGWERRRVEIAEMVKASTREFAAVVDQVADDNEPDYTVEAPLASPIVRIAHTIIQQAIADGAVEIHVDPRGEKVVIQFRIDSTLQEVMRLPGHIRWKLIARYKFMADLDVEEQGMPQEGQIALSHGGKEYDIEVRSQPEVDGETIVMRLHASG